VMWCLIWHRAGYFAVLLFLFLWFHRFWFSSKISYWV
jgi:hypothetical protein